MIRAIVVIAWILVVGYALGVAALMTFPIHVTPPPQPYYP